MLKASTIQLLRIHFSLFLMPVYWLALSQVTQVNLKNAIWVFIILHLLVYPASNGYNSYMDRDTGSIGGIKNPKEPTRQLYNVTLMLDLAAICLGAFISTWFIAGILLFICASRAYSYRGIRLKKYPVAGYLTVVICQGGLVYLLVIHGCSITEMQELPLTGMATATLLIGGFYPLTQVYQHKQDKEDGVTTISYLLGYRGTFIFTGIIYALAMVFLYFLLKSNGEASTFLVIQVFFLPVLLYYSWWFYKVSVNTEAANFINTMRMNILASIMTNASFIYLCIIEKI